MSIESKNVYGKNDKEMILGKNILFPVGLKLIPAPININLVSNHYEIFVAIGDDNIARLIIDEDALKVLRDLNPEASIF